MKKVALFALCILLFCMLSSTTLVNAFYAGYTYTNYQAQVTPTTDGKWTSPDEWLDAMVPTNTPEAFAWREKWTYPEGTTIILHVLFEFFTDNTNSTDDYYQFCVDNTANGGATPQTDDIRIDWVGHSQSGLKVYRGTGTGWTEFTDYTWGTDLKIVETLDESPLNSEPHWIMELTMSRSKTEFSVSSSNYVPGIRLAVYDGDTPAQGVQAWPPTERDFPSDWGQENGKMEQIPETFSIIVVALLSSFAVAGVYLMRKNPKHSVLRAPNMGS